MSHLSDAAHLSRALSKLVRASPNPIPPDPTSFLRLFVLPRVRPSPSTTRSSPPSAYPESPSPEPTSPPPPTSTSPPSSTSAPPQPSPSAYATESSNPTSTPITTPLSPPPPSPTPQSNSSPTSSSTTASPFTATSTSWAPRSRRVPETPLGRLAGFTSLGLGLTLGAAAESARRLVGISSTDHPQSAFISTANAQRLAGGLSRMRGAALKLGQMLSIQDETVIPKPVLEALERVRQGADVMPVWQLERVLDEQLGHGWREKVERFDDEPVAAASIGQVHRGMVDGREVVFKVQYPGVGRSIKSDLGNLKRLVVAGGLIPEKWFVEEAMKVAEEELERECDYVVERENQQRYRELVLKEDRLRGDFYVPEVFPELSSDAVLCSEWVAGVPVDRVSQLGKSERDKVGTLLLRLTLYELFVLGFQQSDPNFSNYLYDADTGRINLIDFGAARAYNEEFLMGYLSLIRACATRDREGVLEWSTTLGFLTGEESSTMLKTHVEASFAVGEPFSREFGKGGFEFTGTDIPKRTAILGTEMLKYRLTPPPKEAYSLHRRLSGAFLMSMKLGAKVDANGMLDEVIQRLITEGRLEK